MISVRRSHLGLPLKLYNHESSFGSNSFGDIYTKINHKFSNKNRVYLSFFYGNDKYKKEDRIVIDSVDNIKDYKSSISWNSFALATRWNHLINDRFFCNTTITYSAYRYNDKKYITKEIRDGANPVTQNVKNLNYYSGIKDFGLKSDFDLPINEKHYIRFGINSSMRIYQPFMEGTLVMFSDESKNPLYIPTFDISYDTIMNKTYIKSYTLSGYIEDDINITDKFKSNFGIRYISYYYKNKVYHSPEPRISARYLFSPNLSLKTGYARMSQNTHLLSNSFLILPFNVWIPSTHKVKPLFSDQYSLTFNYSFKKRINISLEGFYKTIQNDILYKSINQSDNTSTWEDQIEQGMRRSYGLELMINKQVGKITGWLTYTLSKTERKFKNINEGNYFPFWLVRKHKISATFNMKFNERIDFGASWVYSSGVSANAGYQELSPIIYQESTDNNYPFNDSWRLINKIPAYHKMDIGINLHKQKRRGKHTLSLGLNNAYARNNPLLISEYEGYLYLSKINLFMPFIQYRFKFEKIH